MSRCDIIVVEQAASLPNTYPLQLNMQKERWFELCELASKEQDAVKLLALVQEINRLLEEKEQRLKGQKPYDSD